MFWRYCINVKTKCEMFSNFVAFSEYMNFTWNHCKYFPIETKNWINFQKFQWISLGKIKDCYVVMSASQTQSRAVCASLWHAMHAKLSSSLIKTMFVYSMVCTGALYSARLSMIFFFASISKNFWLECNLLFYNIPCKFYL